MFGSILTKRNVFKMEIFVKIKICSTHSCTSSLWLCMIRRHSADFLLTCDCSSLLSNTYRAWSCCSGSFLLFCSSPDTWYQVPQPPAYQPHLQVVGKYYKGPSTTLCTFCHNPVNTCSSYTDQHCTNSHNYRKEVAKPMCPLRVTMSAAGVPVSIGVQ